MNYLNLKLAFLALLWGIAKNRGNEIRWGDVKQIGEI
jgi:hypothetical protein